MVNIEGKQLGEFLQHQTKDTVEKDRDQQATITAIPSWATTGEVKAVLLNGDLIWVSASGNLQELTVDAVIWVRRFGVGQRSQYRMTGYWKDSGGTYKAPAVRQDVMTNSKPSELWASDGDPQAIDTDAAGLATVLTPFTLANGISLPLVAKTAAYTLTTADYTCVVTCTAANITITLPAAADNTDRVYNIKKLDATIYTVIVDANAGEFIDGVITQTIIGQYDSMRIQCDGTGWHII